MKHSFDAEIANEYGVEIAIMFDMFCFWISKNEANNYNFQDGKYWTFNTYEGLHKMFPYWNVQKIKRILNKMVELDLLVKGNYNEKSMESYNLVCIWRSRTKVKKCFIYRLVKSD